MNILASYSLACLKGNKFYKAMNQSEMQGRRSNKRYKTKKRKKNKMTQEEDANSGFGFGGLCWD